MTDVITIPTAIATLKNAIDIAKAIRNADISLDKAELKLQLAELTGLLLEAKNEVFGLNEQLRDKDSEIHKLIDALAFKEKLVRIQDVYFRQDENSTPIGDPYCAKCFEADSMGIHLIITNNGRQRTCPACQTAYYSYRSALPTSTGEAQ